jgi:hypothetical protein
MEINESNNVQGDSHTLQGDSHTLQGDSHYLQGDSHHLQGDHPAKLRRFRLVSERHVPRMVGLDLP